jgi:hypothetical protein
MAQKPFRMVTASRRVRNCHFYKTFLHPRPHIPRRSRSYLRYWLLLACHFSLHCLHRHMGYTISSSGSLVCLSDSVGNVGDTILSWFFLSFMIRGSLRLSVPALKMEFANFMVFPGTRLVSLL